MKKYLVFSFGVWLTACSEGETKVPPMKDKSLADSLPTEHKVEKNDAKKQENVIHTTTTENKLINLIWALPEVQALNEEVETKSKDKRHLSLRISSEPSDDQEYYGVAVAEDNGEALATYFEFHIYPGNEIRYYDPIEDQELTLKEWRKKEE